MKKLNEFLKEGRQLDHYNDIKNNIPIKDSDVIRVYHGFYSLKDVLIILKYGLSGKERARRIYSYESGNNPNGLFVSSSLKTIINAGFGNNSGTIIEFNTKVSNLEAPVWKGQDSYYVQGQYTKSFKDSEERKKEILRKREIASNSKYDAISKSDRPEVAYMLLDSPEKQALFTGDLNPNMIKAVWVNEKLMKDKKHGGNWIRLTPKEYLKKYKDYILNKYDDNYFKNEIGRKKSKIFKPNDNINIKTLKEFIKQYKIYHNNITLQEIVNDKIKLQQLKNFLWPKQIKQLKSFIQQSNIKK